jgi:iron complex transport system ATP-binding protein
MLVGSDLSYRAGGRDIVAGIDIEVAAGEVLALVGPNGAGKSTLLGLLAADLAPAGGGITIDGRALRGLRPRALARLRAVMPQQTRLEFAFTAAEVVALGAYAGQRQGARGAHGDRQLALTALRRVDAEALADRSFPSLSGGEQARVTLARVLAQDAPVVLLDEPTAHLDLRHQGLVLKLARDVAAMGRAVVVVLHDVNLAARWADRLMILAGGRVAACGPPEVTLTASTLTEVYAHPIDVVPHPLTGTPLALPAA